jgi:outer membrane receptor protein involved in Fe transport
MYYEQYKDRYWGAYYDLYNTQYSFGIIFNDPQNQDRFAQELRLTSQSDSRFQWMMGLYYEDLHDDWFYGSTNPYLLETPAWEYAQYLAYYYNYYGYPVDYPLKPTNLAYTNRLDRDQKQKSAFGEISFDITDKWRVLGGARWFEYKRFYWEQNQFPEGLAPPGSIDVNGIFETESKVSDTMFKFSTQYQIDDSKMVYFLFSQGFRLGGNNNPRAVERSGGDVPPVYKPDIVDNFEIGLKSQWLENRLLFNATLFHMEWKDYQETGGTGAWWLQGWFNAGTAIQEGVEFNGTMLFTDNFSVNYSMIFANPRFDEDYEFPGGQKIVKGMPMPNSPKRKFFVAADYTIPGLFGSEDVFLHYDFSYQSETWNQLSAITEGDTEGIIEAWNVSNFRAGANLKNDWSVTLVVRNLFDQKAISDLDGGFQRFTSDLFNTTFNRDKRTYNRPRTIGVQVRKRFN